MMKKFMYGVFLVLLSACAKEALWNQDSTIPNSRKGRIMGQLINDDDDQPLKGVKILFQRQTHNDGTNSFVDTVSTDSEGKFSYAIPFPNKVRVAIRDTGRFEADTTIVEVLEHQDYPITMNSHPKFGVSTINVHVLKEDDSAIQGVRVGLYVRESGSEDYSAVDTLLSNQYGFVSFDNLAFPVHYKVEIAEPEIAYTPDAIEGILRTKDPLDLTLHSEVKFGKADVTLIGKYFYTNTVAVQADLAVSVKSLLDDAFSDPQVMRLDANGRLNFPDLIYPAEIKITSIEGGMEAFLPVTLTVSESNASQPIVVNLYDAEPRYWDVTPSEIIGENTLVAFYEGIGVQEMELDSKGNIYAVTTDNSLIRVSYDGTQHKVLATGFTSSWGIALQDDYTLYVVENSNGHSVKKVVIDRETDQATVSLFAGDGSSSGTTDGIGTEARFNRPSDAVYDPQRKCLWVVEWSGQRIRKIDVVTRQVTTVATGTGFGFGVGLTKNNKYLYIASHTSPAGIVKYNIDNGQMFTVRTGYSIRHLAVASNDDIYFNINGNYQAKQYKLTKEVLLEGNVGNTSSTFETVAGNGTWGVPHPVGYEGTANTVLGTGNVDGSPNGITYDPYRGRLYFAVSGDKRIYYLKRSSISKD